MKNFGLLILRLTVGTLLMGHGSQKLFGWFGGSGLKGTHGMMEMMGMKPGKVWGTMAALAEFNGGLLTALGFLNPLGPLNIMAAMSVATRRAHWGKPVWASKGGAELALTNFAAASAIALAGPGKFSLDRAFGIRLPRPVVFLVWLGTTAMTFVALNRPEAVQTLLDQFMPGTAYAPSSPDLEVENRPAPSADQTATQPAQEQAPSV